MIQNLVGSVFNIMTHEGRIWNIFRLMLILLMITGMAFWSASVFTRPEQFPWVLFSLAGLRFWVFPIAGFLGALLIVGHYISDLYELPGLTHGVRHTLSILFGFGLPALHISDGRVENNINGINLLERIGGPGLLNVDPGNLVILENQTGPSNVYAGGSHFVSRRETIKDVVSLEDYHGFIDERRATTRDGIPVIVRNINYHFRLRPPRRAVDHSARRPDDPFPYSMQGIRNYVYNRSVTPDGLTGIDAAMNINVGGAITDFISDSQFEQLMLPGAGTDPRMVIRNQLSTPARQNQFRNLGMELLWVDIGHFDVEDNVWAERVRTWGARWVGTAEIDHALGESQRLTSHSRARAEGRADALRGLIETFEDARLNGTPPQSLRNLILLYTAQILEEIGEYGVDQSPGELPGGE
jgi:hypothetical protein